MCTIVSRMVWLLIALILSAPAEPSFALQASKRQKSAPSGPPTPGGVEVDLSPFEVSPRVLSFGAVSSGQQQSLALTLKNTGPAPLLLSRILFLLGASGNSSAFRVVLDGKTYLGGPADTF